MRIVRARNAVIAGLAAVLASGCVLGPDYARPTIEAPASYRYDSPEAQAARSLADVSEWWTGFGDPDLDALVRETLAANHDLRIATARVDEFAARAGVTRAQGLPQVGYGADAGRQGQGSDAVGNYSTVLSARWELDLWGRIRRENEAARADLFATEEARRGVALTLVSTVVSGYITLLELDRSLAIAEATAAGRKESVELFRVRLEGGAVSDFEMMQVTAEYEAAVSAIPDLRLAIAQQEHALSALAGRNPGPDRARPRARNARRAGSIAPGLPSALLERRPDILQAEQQLVAANARIGAARTLYFPNIALTGFAGSASTQLDDLFSGPARAWSFSGQLLGPIFSGGAIESTNRQVEAQHEQALEAYRATIQDAFRDVDDALVSLRESRELIASLDRRVTALARAVELATLRYDNGAAELPGRARHRTQPVQRATVAGLRARRWLPRACRPVSRTGRRLEQRGMT